MLSSSSTHILYQWKAFFYSRKKKDKKENDMQKKTTTKKIEIILKIRNYVSSFLFIFVANNQIYKKKHTQNK